MTTLIQCNCNGIRSKHAELQLIINEHRPKFLAIQETRTKPGLNFNIKGYTSIFTHRPSGQGGVAILIKKEIPFTQLPLHTHMEIVAIEVKIPFKTTIVSIYIPPNTPLDKDELDKILAVLPKPTIIAGDLNEHHAQWDPQKQDARGKEIVKILDKHDLITLNDGQTTFIHSANLNEKPSTSAIDVTICSPELAAKLDWNIINDQHSSDHFPIKIGTTQSNSRRKQYPKWKIELADWNKFEDYLETHIKPDQEYSIESLSAHIREAAAKESRRSSTNKISPNKDVYIQQKLHSRRTFLPAGSTERVITWP